METALRSILKLRTRAAHCQNLRCWYCGFPIWTADSAAFASQFAISARQAMHFQCTAEHLVARQDGGRDEPGNVVAACIHCNRTRHRKKQPPNAGAYRIEVEARVRKGLWHPAWAHAASAPTTAKLARRGRG